MWTDPERARAYYRERYRMLVSLNICVDCERNEPMPGKRRCGFCSERHGEYRKKAHKCPVHFGDRTLGTNNDAA